LLGDVFNEDNWEQVFVNKEIPQYFLDIPPDVEVGPVLRNHLPKDSHLIEQELTVYLIFIFHSLDKYYNNSYCRHNKRLCTVALVALI
jgi:hypothetical protein